MLLTNSNLGGFPLKKTKISAFIYLWLIMMKKLRWFSFKKDENKCFYLSVANYDERIFSIAYLPYLWAENFI